MEQIKYSQKTILIAIIIKINIKYELILRLEKEYD